jgi:hypothetical protein
MLRSPAALALLVLVALSCAALAGLILRVSDLPLAGTDDAHIFFVYAQHLAQGAGLVFNVGGERVEGFTSLLWTLLLAPFFAAAADPRIGIAALDALLVGFALARAAVFLSPQRSCLRAAPTWVLVAWVLLSPTFLMWTIVSFMETGLWSAIVLLLALELIACARTPWQRVRDALPFAVLLLLAVLTRPEAMALGPGLLMLATLLQRRGGGPWRPALAGWLVFAAAELALLAFRLAYFGQPLPNTYYAKISPDRLYLLGEGVDYLAQFLWQTPLAAALAALSVWHSARFLPHLLRTGTTRTSAVEMRGACSLIVVALLLLPVLGGGDHFGAFRFYQPLWPLLVLPLLIPGAVALAGRPRAVQAAALAALLGGHVLLDGTGWPEHFARGSQELRNGTNIAMLGRKTGAALETTFAGTALPEVAAVTVGGLKHAYRGAVFDLMGLNHVAMGHSDNDRRGMRSHAAFDKRVFWSVRPAGVWPVGLSPGDSGLVNGMRFDPWMDAVLKGLLTDADFQAAYSLAVVHRQGAALGIVLFAENGWLAQLEADARWTVQKLPHRQR